MTQLPALVSEESKKKKKREEREKKNRKENNNNHQKSGVEEKGRTAWSGRRRWRGKAFLFFFVIFLPLLPTIWHSLFSPPLLSPPSLPLPPLAAGGREGEK